MNWDVIQSRPITYSAVELSNKFNRECLEDLKRANRTSGKLSPNPVKELFPRTKGKLAVERYSDVLRREHVKFLTEGDNLAATLAWNNNKVKRVVGSTIAAEALILQAAVSHGFYLREILIEILGVDKEDIPIKA